MVYHNYYHQQIGDEALNEFRDEDLELNVKILMWKTVFTLGICP